MYFKAMEGKFRNCIVRFGEVVFSGLEVVGNVREKGGLRNKKQVLLRNRGAIKSTCFGCVLCVDRYSKSEPQRCRTF